MTEDSGKAAGGRFIRPKDLDNENRATLGARIQWRLESLAWDWIYWYPMKALPIEWASNVGAAVVRTLGPLASQHRTIVRNLRMCFPEWTNEQVKRVARGAWENLGRVVGEMPHLKRIQPYTPDTRVEVEGVEHLESLRDNPRSAVFIGTHMANWELISATICRKLPDAHITYRAANNPHIDKRIALTRLSAGIESLTPKGAGTRDLMRALAQRKVIGLMVDQKFNQGIAAPFFGYDAMTAPGATRLAKRFNCPIVPIACLRTGPARYRLTVYEPFMPDADPDEDKAVFNTVLRMNRWVESCIRAAPEQWFWMHHRWPKEAWLKAGVI